MREDKLNIARASCGAAGVVQSCGQAEAAGGPAWARPDHYAALLYIPISFAMLLNLDRLDHLVDM